MNASDYYLKFIAEYGITDEVNYLQLYKSSDETLTQKIPYFDLTNKSKNKTVLVQEPNGTNVKKTVPVSYAGIQINYPSLDGYRYEIHKKIASKNADESDEGKFKLIPFYRIRLMNPLENKDGRLMKYYQEFDTGWFPFWTFLCLTAFKNKQKVKKVVFCEGEKKAFALAMQGIYAIGLPSKDGFINGSGKIDFHHDIIRFLIDCQVEEVSLLLDADTKFIKPEYIEKQTDLFKRVNLFCHTAKNFFEAFKLACQIPEIKLQDCYFQHQKSSLIDTAKGIDDLLHIEGSDRVNICKQLLKFDSKSDYFETLNLSKAKWGAIEKHFGIYVWSKELEYDQNKFKEMTLFLETYKDFIVPNSFHYKGSVYNINQTSLKYEENKALKPVLTLSKEDKPKSDKSEYKKKKEDRMEMDGGFGTAISFDEKGIHYWGKDSIKRIATGFHIHLVYQSKNENDKVAWIVNIEILVNNKTISFELSNDDFHSAGSWKKKLSEHSLSFKLTDVMLTELIDYLFIEENHKFATKVIRYGWHEESQTWLFSNMAFDGKTLIEPDKHRIIEANNIYVSLPELTSEQNPFVYTETDIRFNQWYMLYNQAYPKHSFWMAAYYVFTVFMDISKARKNGDINPIIYIKGRANSGKTTMVELLGTLFGYVQENTSLKGNPTARAVQKLLSNMHNSFLHCDEYHHNEEFNNFFVSAFNYKGYSLTPKDSINLVQTAKVPVTRGIVLTSNEEPTYEPFVTRLMYYEKDDLTKNPIEKAAHDQLQELAKSGCSSVTIELLRYRELIKEQYDFCFSELWASINNELIRREIEVKTRNINMTTVCLCSAYILQKHGKINIGLESESHDDVLTDYTMLAVHQILFQHRKQQTKSALSKFFEMMQSFFFSYKIYEGSHFRFIDNGINILIDISSIYPMYQKEYFIINREMPASKDEIINSLAEAIGVEKDKVLKKTGRMYDVIDKESEQNLEKLKLNKVINSPISVTYDFLVDTYGVDFSKRQHQI